MKPQNDIAVWMGLAFIALAVFFSAGCEPEGWIPFTGSDDDENNLRAGGNIVINIVEGTARDSADLEQRIESDNRDKGNDNR